jgi:uncharacterized protein
MATVEFPDGKHPFFSRVSYPVGKREDRKKTDGVKARAFTEILGEAEEAGNADDDVGREKTDAPVEELLDELHGKGEILKAEPTMENVRRYKEAVRTFMDYVVKNIFAIEERMSGTNILKRKKFTLLTVIDGKLDRLAAGVLREQKDQLELLRRVDEINGLLVDLLR